MADKLIKGVSIFGKYYVAVTSIIVIIIALILGVAAIFMIMSNTSVIKTTASIIQKNCTPSTTQSSESMYNCDLTVSYTVNGVIYTSNIKTNSLINYKIGENIEVEYNSDNPKNIELKITNDKTIGAILLGLSIIAIIVASIRWYIVKKYELASTVSGFSGIYNIMK